MKTKELIAIINKGKETGKFPIVQFNKNIKTIESADPGMYGRAVGYSDLDSDWDDEKTTVIFNIDMSEFIDHNMGVAKPIWIDTNQNNVGKRKLVTWFESEYYPKDHVENVVEVVKTKHGDSHLFFIDSAEPSAFYLEFLKLKDKGDLTYTEFLERKLTKI